MFAMLYLIAGEDDATVETRESLFQQQSEIEWLYLVADVAVGQMEITELNKLFKRKKLK